MEYIIQRWTNGSWRYVGSVVSSFEAECAVKGLNQFGEWEYRFVRIEP